MNEIKKLKRSNDDRIISGVFGGLGEYLLIDSSLLRLIGIVLMLLTAVFPLTIAYLVAIVLIPDK